MDDLIDREALIAAYKKLSGIPWNKKAAPVSWSHAYEEFIDNIEEFPAVDAVYVVRCKDCIRRYDTDECPMCYVSGGRYYEYTSGNGYCDRGERKDNETD